MYGKIVIMILMFIGRLGPIVAFRVFFNTGKKKTNVKYVDGDLMLWHFGMVIFCIEWQKRIVPKWNKEEEWKNSV